MTRRALLLGLALTALVTAARAPTAAADPVFVPVLAEVGGHQTTGEIVVDASPAEVYRVVTTYGNWSNLLKDVAAAAVTAGGRHDATVQLHSRALDRRITVQFDNVPDRLIRFRLTEGPRGARVHGAYEITPIDGGQRSRITGTLHLDVVGLAGAFVSDRETREMRQRKLRGELEDLARYFARAARR